MWTTSHQSPVGQAFGQDLSAYSLRARRGAAMPALVPGDVRAALETASENIAFVLSAHAANSIGKRWKTYENMTKTEQKRWTYVQIYEHEPLSIWTFLEADGNALQLLNSVLRIDCCHTMPLCLVLWWQVWSRDAWDANKSQVVRRWSTTTKIHKWHAASCRELLKARSFGPICRQSWPSRLCGALVPLAQCLPPWPAKTGGQSKWCKAFANASTKKSQVASRAMVCETTGAAGW